MSTANIQSTRSEASSHINVRVIAAMVFIFGAGLVFTVGFAHSAYLHNAAHDTRHALAFPCH